MFGNKKEKQERLEQEAALLEQEALTQAELARRVGVDRATVLSDLTALEDKGIHLQEEADGKLRLHKWW